MAAALACLPGAVLGAIAYLYGSGPGLPPVLQGAVYGAAIVGAAFVLCWGGGLLPADVYSLWDSLRAIRGYLEKHEFEHVESALADFRCFEPYAEDPQAYARMPRGWPRPVARTRS